MSCYNQFCYLCSKQNHCFSWSKSLPFFRMLERLKGRTGVICFCFVIWAALTLAHFMDVEFFSGITSKFQMSHFLKASQTLKRRPGPGADQVGDKTSSDEEEEKKEEKKEEEEEKVKDQEVDDLVAEAGHYDAWWREQIGRRVRVAETCVRCESSHFVLLFHVSFQFCEYWQSSFQ